MPNFCRLATTFMYMISKFPLSMSIFMQKHCQFWIPELEIQQPNGPQSAPPLEGALRILNSYEIFNNQIGSQQRLVLEESFCHFTCFVGMYQGCHMYASRRGPHKIPGMYELSARDRNGTVVIRLQNNWTTTLSLASAQLWLQILRGRTDWDKRQCCCR